MRCGKSTQSSLLAARLGLPRASIDAIAWDYYLADGIDRDHAQRLAAKHGELACYRYFEGFLVSALERHLREHADDVIDLGAGHTVSSRPEDPPRIRNLLAPFPNIVLLLPSADLDVSSAVLRERTADIPWLHEVRKQSGLDLNDWFLRRPDNANLATHTVYTHGRTPQETCDEIVRCIQRK
jgi:hypothetical protein